MAVKNNLGMTSLAAVISSRMQKAAESPRILDFGTIEKNFSLRTDTFPVSIPKTDYVVCQHIGGIPFFIKDGKHEGHESGNGEHKHEVVIPPIQPDDRVLVAWIGSEAIVIDTILSAEKLEVKK